MYGSGLATLLGGGAVAPVADAAGFRWIAVPSAFVVSPRGRYVHGSLIDIDGGQTKTI